MPEIDRHSDRAAYRQIADQLRASILNGVLGPGEKLPSERELAATYGVDRATARRAVQELNVGGLVVAEHGRGVFVRQRPPVRRVSRNRMVRRDQRGFYGDLEDAGVKAQVTTTIRREPSPEAIAGLLELEPGTEVVARHRHMAGDGVPLQLATTYFPPKVVDRVPQLEEQNTGPGGMYSRLEDAGFRLVQEDIVSARMPLPEEMRALRLAPGVPLMVIVRVTRDEASKEPLEVTEVRLAADRNELRYQV